MAKRPEIARAVRACRTAATLVFMLAGCAGSPPVAKTETEDGPSRILQVANHGWHTGLIVRSAEIPEDAWPARRDFPDARYLELGWGDREYYVREDPSIWIAMRALLWPTNSAIHAVAVRGTIEREFPTSEIVELRVSAAGFQRLVDFVAASHARDAAGDWIVLAPGQRPNRSRFYASERRFHLFETCNTWVAGALREAGAPVNPRAAITAGSLMRQVRGAREPRARRLSRRALAVASFYARSAQRPSRLDFRRRQLLPLRPQHGRRRRCRLPVHALGLPAEIPAAQFSARGWLLDHLLAADVAEKAGRPTPPQGGRHSKCSACHLRVTLLPESVLSLVRAKVNERI